MFRKTVAWTVLAYGIALAVIGFIGYYRKASLPSVLFGAGFGVLMVLCSLALFAKNKLGAYIALILTLFLTALFAYRYTITENPVPAILAVISGGMLLFLFVQTIKWKKLN